MHCANTPWLLCGRVGHASRLIPLRGPFLWSSGSVFIDTPKGNGFRDIGNSLMPGSVWVQNNSSTSPSTHRQLKGPWPWSPEAKADGGRTKLQNEYMHACLRVNHRNAFSER